MLYIIYVLIYNVLIHFFVYVTTMFKEEAMNLGGTGGRIGLIKGWKEERNRSWNDVILFSF